MTTSSALPVLPGARAPVFVRLTEGADAAVETTDWLLGTVRVAPAGVRAVPVAVLRTAPASTSAWVTVYVAVAVTDWAGARVPATPGHE